jgi:hypothetical protein
MAKYEVEELPPVSKWKKLKWQLTPYLHNTEWLVFNTGRLEAEFIESSYFSKTLRYKISLHYPALVFVLFDDVLKLAQVPAAPPVRSLESGLVYGIKLQKGVSLQNPAIHKPLTYAIVRYKGYRRIRGSQEGSGTVTWYTKDCPR